MSEVSLKRFYFALFDDGLTLKTLKLVYIGFCIQTLHIFPLYLCSAIFYNTSIASNNYSYVCFVVFM